MTSRHHPDGQIVSDFRIRLEERNQDDIQKYIERELRLPDETKRAKDELKHLLQAQAHGSFLWLVLLIRRIYELSSKGVNMKAIKSDVLRCPQQLDQFYEELLREIEKTELLEVGRMFQWICFAARSLSLNEFRIALTIHASGRKVSVNEYFDEDNSTYIPNEQKMRKRVTYLSRGLVDFANTSSADGETLVGFYHESIKEFMLTKGLQIVDRKLGDSRGLAKVANLQLTNTCLSCLSISEISRAISVKDRSYLKQFVFLAYAKCCWLSHAIKTEENGLGEQID